MSRALVVLAGALALAGPAAAQVQPYGANDSGGFRDVLPPGINGLGTAEQVVAFRSGGLRPAHSDDQLAMYRDLLWAAPSLDASSLGRFFKDATFGVRRGDVERTYSPRSDVRILRDRDFGVPHVYGRTRAGTMFGVGYATAEDRLFVLDMLRHWGRAQLTSFLGPAWRQLDRVQWRLAPYTEADLDRQLDALPRLLRDDVRAYTAGINAHMNRVRGRPLELAAEYEATDTPAGPRPWRATDVLAIAALTGGALLAAGGNEVQNAVALQAFRERYGAFGGRHFARFRAASDPEAFPHVKGVPFPYMRVPSRPRGMALPDPGSLREEPVVLRTNLDGDVAVARPNEPEPTALPRSMSNAMLVSARESESGHPLGLFGPQIGFSAPQLWMEQDVHGPGIDARGGGFPGTNLYVQIGRGRDYAWGATSGGSDVTDTFAVRLCEPDGSPPRIESVHYLLRGRCRGFELLEQGNAWAGRSERLLALRTPVGIVSHRGTVGGVPVAYVRRRVSYGRELESALGWASLNDPNSVRGPRSFQRAVARMFWTYNWMYLDARRIAYFSSGGLPDRHPRAHPDFPVFARYGWRGLEPFAAHPRVVDQRFIVSWNNKQAHGFRSADGHWSGSSVDRAELLAFEIRRRIRGRRTISRVELVQAMQDAATTDLRGQAVLPVAFALLGRPSDPELADALRTLQDWVAAGAHRRDLDRDGRYDNADAVAIMDAWWPQLVASVFEPSLEPPLYDVVVRNRIGLGDLPSSGHAGTAFDDGIWGHVEKDLRRALGERVPAWPPSSYCGLGDLERCRADVLDSLRRALTVERTDLYRGEGCSPGDQVCADEVRFSPRGLIPQPAMPFNNRPTYQMLAEPRSRVPR